nr:MAG TPA: YvrJ protein family protein [Caudoviricetes sp.]
MKSLIWKNFSKGAFMEILTNTKFLQTVVMLFSLYLLYRMNKK